MRETTATQHISAYLIVPALFVGTTLLRFALDPLLGTQNPFTIYLALVVLVTWFCGRVWGTLTSFVGALAADYFFVEPRYTAGVASVGMVTFGATAIALVALVGRWKAAEEAQRHMARQLRERNAQLDERAGELQAATISAERAKTAAEEANRAKNRFIAVLSHELRTPLTPILTAVTLIDRDPTRAREYVRIIRRNVELEARLIDDLLDVSRIERGKVELDKHHVQLCEVIERAIEVCRPDIDARGLQFHVDFGPRPYIVNADSARIQQAFWNLLKNAVKFTPKGGSVGVRCDLRDDHVVVDVWDTGVGIEARAVARIFEAFTQEHRQQFGGLGLGLAISKALVELHGGSIEAHSEGVNKGATLTVRLPLALSDRRRLPRAADARAPRARTAPLHVLLVEDHGDTAEMMVSLLELEGHRVQTAADVTTALETAQRSAFDLLISDLGLPDKSGFDLIRELRSRGHTLPAIAISGYGQEQDIDQSRAAGFAAHLIKPVDPERLLTALGSLMKDKADHER
ncbi:MAG: response regulator [Acidobacteria bacterium]|nr:response regulator [Acidobacteriota bacterium]